MLALALFAGVSHGFTFAPHQGRANSAALVSAHSRALVTPRLPRAFHTIHKSSILGLAEGSDEPEFDEGDYEEALATLVFTSADPSMEVIKNMELYDERFVAWAGAKADASTDVEERTALRSLCDMIIEIQAKVAQLVEEDVEGPTFEDAQVVSESAPEPSGLLGANGEPVDVVTAMKDVQMGGIDKEAEAEAKMKLEEQEEAKRLEAEKKALATYLELIQSFLDVADDKEALAAKVKEDYYRCDYRFLQVCKEQAKASVDVDVQNRIQLIVDAVNTEANNKLAEAGQKVQTVLQAGSPGLMETAVAKLAKSGGVDEAVLNLLDANILGAQQAGATDAVQVLTRVRDRAFLELDKLKSPEQRLMSQLLRTDSSEDRKDALKKAFTPVESLIVGMENEGADPMPEVTPPDFIELTKTMIRNFGNLGLSNEENLEERLLQIAREAEEMSTSIYGQAMTAREQQDRAWNEGSVSVWDLEMLEQQAEINGEHMPWHGDVDEQKFVDAMQGFSKDGKKQIGGQ